MSVIMDQSQYASSRTYSTKRIHSIVSSGWEPKHEDAFYELTKEAELLQKSWGGNGAKWFTISHSITPGLEPYEFKNNSLIASPLREGYQWTVTVKWEE